MADTVFETRGPQMFPTLGAADIERLRRFGEPRRYAEGESVARAGEAGLGLTVVLSGQVQVCGRDAHGRPEPIVTHGPGAFMGELAQLSGKPALVDAEAVTEVDALILPPEKLRAVMVAEAELGERIMRALILRRVGLIEAGVAGPVIVGGDGDGDVLRLQNFLRRNGQPHTLLDPAQEEEARALIDRFHVDPGQLPLVVCPGGQVLRNPGESELARCMGLVAPLDLRRSLRGRGAGGSGRGRLCRLGGAIGPGARLPRFRRPGRRLVADRELSGLSHRHQRHGPDGAGL
jgi:thioredoxin reductase (NADPH)